MRHSTNHDDAPCEHDHGGNNINDNSDLHFDDYGRRYLDDNCRGVYHHSFADDDHYHDAVDHDDLVKRIHNDYVNHGSEHDINDNQSDDDVPNVYYAARDLVTHVDLGPADNEHGEPYNSLVRAVYDAAAAVLGIAQHDTADRSADTDAAMRAYVYERAWFDLDRSLGDFGSVCNAARAFLDASDD